MNVSEVNRILHGCLHCLEILNLFLVLNRISHSFASLSREISCSILEINFIFSHNHMHVIFSMYMYYVYMYSICIYYKLIVCVCGVGGVKINLCLDTPKIRKNLQPDLVYNLTSSFK